MNLPQSIKTFLKSLPLKSMVGEDIFVAIVFYLANGKKTNEVETKNVKNNWAKTLIGKKYNDVYSNRAQGNIVACGRGKVCLTDEGIVCVESLFEPTSTTSSTSLHIFEKGSTHSFDKFLRRTLKNAKKSVDIADTYVSASLFDNLLDEIKNSIPIRFLYGKDVNGFVARSVRFSKQYIFHRKESKEFHDRFLLIDGKGYIIGPSLKDAADKKPATVVILSENDSKKLAKLFSDLWT